MKLSKEAKRQPRRSTVISVEQIYGARIARLACGCTYALSPGDRTQPGDSLMCRNKEHR